ncbi:MAG: DUF6514 family protein [Oscillospiraceae bacterium]|nr:DUF6514 family protein [Oscillospiraceae bacterium]
MKIKYKLKVERIYGISAIDEKGYILCSISTIGKSKREVVNLIKLCNSEKLEPVHLKDVIEDTFY